MGDPFLDSIIRALDGELDPTKFEDCVVDLIRKDFPGAAHVRGGNDAGTDGAVPSPDGLVPVITTTQKDVLQNLTKSLTANRANHNVPKAIFATSRAISAETRRKLLERAKELGYTLLQIYQRRTIAELLYWSPRWCRDLLQLAGEPSALSPFPLSSRPTLARKIVARGLDLRWLSQTSGDRALVGHPGAGKTCVLRRCARTNDALFVVDNDRGRIASAIRERRPRVLIVDDAHLKPEFLVSLHQLRKEIYADYQILAACWPGAKNDVQRALALGDKQVRELRLLTRDEIVRVVQSTGLTGPNALVREIVNQAEGRAGLAISLVQCVLNGDFKRLETGEELTSSLVDALAASVGKEAKAVLAAFAIGGDMGMQLDAVANFLRKDLASVYQIISELAQGGIIRSREQAYIVMPPALQQALVRDVFFNRRAPFDCRSLLSESRSPSLVEVLVGAKLRGATIPSAQIQTIFPETDACGKERSKSAWVKAAAGYAWLGPSEARWALESYPEALYMHPRIFLEKAPDRSIDILLAHAAHAGGERALNSNPNHPFRIINDWIGAHPGDIAKSVHRRKRLLSAANRWLDAARDPAVAVRAASIAMSPSVKWSESDPGSGNKLTISHGLVPSTEIERMAPLWKKVRDIVARANGIAWKHVVWTIRSWVYGNAWTSGGENTCRAMRAVMVKELQIFAELATGRPAVLSEFHRFAKRLDADYAIVVDPDFEKAVRANEDHVLEYDEWSRETQRVAQRWAQHEPSYAASRMHLYVEDSEALGLNSGPLRSLCYELARALPERLPWAKIFGTAGVRSDLVEPFLKFAVASKEDGWVDLVAEWMDHDRLRSIAICASVFAVDCPGFLPPQ